MGNVYIPLLVFSMHKLKDKERNSFFFLGNVGFGYCCREDLKAVGYKLKQTIEIFKFVVMWKLQIYMSLDLKNTSCMRQLGSNTSNLALEVPLMAPLQFNYDLCSESINVGLCCTSMKHNNQ